MKTDLENYNFNKNGGIYFIKNIANNRIYVGSTLFFRKRFFVHLKSLKNNKHINSFLQNDFNKCGEKSFIFEIVCVIKNKKEMLLKEQEYINLFYDNQKNCYNFRKTVIEDRYQKKQKNTTNHELDKRCKKRTEEQKKQMSKIIRDFIEENPEHIKNISNKMKNIWAIRNKHKSYCFIKIDTNEEIVVFGSLREYAINNNLNYKALHLLVRGKHETSQGLRLKKPND